MIFSQRPADFKEKFVIVSCFVERDGYFLLLQRQNSTSEPNKWGPPAGKVHAGEEFLQAIQRELMEETGLVISGTQLLFLDETFVRHSDYGFDFVYREYLYTPQQKPSIVLNPCEHQKYRRVRPEQALAMNLMPGEEYMVQKRYGIGV